MVTILKSLASSEVVLATLGLIVILALEILGELIGFENVIVTVLLTGTPVAVSAGSEEEMSRLGTLEANR
jgi:hypothetical protein